MTIAASDIPAVTTLMSQRAQLRSRLSRVGSTASLADMAKLFEGTGLESGILTLSQTQVSQYLANQIASIETQLSGLGVDLNA